MNLPRPRRLTILAALLAGAGIAAGAADLPNIGDSAENYLSTTEEQTLGKVFMRNVRQALQVVNDPEVESYIQSLGYRLVASSGTQGRQFTYFVVNDPAINAFAGFGGYIGVNTGLILVTQSEAELAAVIGHETAHVAQRHLARAIEQSARMSAPMTAAIIAAILLGSQTSQGGQIGEAALAATIAGNAQQQINFTRTNEWEADRIGMRFLAGAGFDPHAMPDFFERLQKSSYENLQYSFLYTHPVTTERIADSRNRAEQLPRARDAEANGNYSLIRAKVRVLQDNNPQKSAEYFENTLATAPASEKDALAYGYALSLLALGQDKEALAQLRPLIARDPERIAYQILLAQIQLAGGQTTAALATYERNLGLYPYNLPLTTRYVGALLQADQAKKASATINAYFRQRPPEAELYALQARAAGMLGRSTEMHLALAEHHYQLGETRAAIEQLRIAQRSAPEDDGHLRARIDARMDELQTAWKAERKVSGEEEKKP
ncbi:MAG: M48 family metallopeptidase [Gammaproteobacteria bacterium]|nr:M48 family metallopeptidase [Gammaproteobacteria bacterium]